MRFDPDLVVFDQRSDQASVSNPIGYEEVLKTALEPIRLILILRWFQKRLESI